VASGDGVHDPAILLMGYDLDTAASRSRAVGGLMGVLMMIRCGARLIVKEHDTLVYPEGTACAEVLIAGEERRAAGQARVQAFAWASSTSS